MLVPSILPLKGIYLGKCTGRLCVLERWVCINPCDGPGQS